MDPHRYLQRIAARLDAITTGPEIQAALDELETLFETLDPELQDLAAGLIETLHARLAGVDQKP